MQYIYYIVTGISISSRIVFIYIMYSEGVKQNLPIIFCIMNISSCGLMLYEGVSSGDILLQIRNTCEIIFLCIACVIIFRNKYISHHVDLLRK